MADIQKKSQSYTDLKIEQDRLRDELNAARNAKASPEKIAALKADLAKAVAATRAAKEAQ